MPPIYNNDTKSSIKCFTKSSSNNINEYNNNKNEVNEFYRSRSNDDPDLRDCLN
jgi:hypothetical protein